MRELRVGSIAKPGHDAGRHDRCGLRSAVGRPDGTPTLFPTAAFAALSDDPVPEDVAAMFQAALADTAGDGGIAATVMTPDGTWSGAAGKADGVHDMQPDSQFGIASGTKPIIAAQVMQLVEAGEVSSTHPPRSTSLLTSPSTPTAQRSASS